MFLATRPHPEFAIGPFFVRTSVTPALGVPTVDVLWSLVIPSTTSGAMIEQDLYLLWPDEVDAFTVEGPPDATLARYVKERGYSVIREGRLPLYAQGLYRGGREVPPQPLRDGAPFVSFVREGGPLGLTAPVTYVRIPWTPLLANRTWLISLRMGLHGLIKPKQATWVENIFWGRAYIVSLTFNDVRPRAMLPLYLENRDRLVRLADEPASLLINFAHTERLKIQDIFPRTSGRRRSETLESTEEVSHFLEKPEGITPQVLTVQFSYLTGWQSWAPVLIPAVFFGLGSLARPVVALLATRIGEKLAATIHFGPSGAPRQRRTGTVIPRDTLARIAPGVTTYEEVLRLCGPDPEEYEQSLTPDRRVLIYRGGVVVPQRRRRFGWLATVSRWDAEHHEVEITLEQNVVQNVQAHIRRTHLTKPDGS